MPKQLQKPVASGKRIFWNSAMPTAKKPAVRSRPESAPAAAKAADPGEAALAKLGPRLEKIPQERLSAPRADVSAASSFVLSEIVPRLADPALLARLKSVPAAEFDASAIADLEPAAQAALWTQGRLASAEAQESGVRLPLTLIDEATSLRARMLKLADYHLGEKPQAKAELDDIRSGQGYLDLAEDLRRLAVLYRSSHETLRLDTRFYRQEDAETAGKLSQRIVSELRPQGPGQAREQAWRAWALLVERYEEVAAAGRFILRRQGGETAFPSLYTASRAQRRNKKPDSPASPPQDPPASP